MRVVVLGAAGFVGSAFVAWLSAQSGVEAVPVTRTNYAQLKGTQSDIVIDASGNSKKYLAEERPLEEFELSVTHRLRTLQDFPASLQVHLSTVDVYSDLTTPAMTYEEALIDLNSVSRYGLHKLLAEQLVRHYAAQWLIVRLAGMVGPGLRKNPVYDILHQQPLRIHPDSQYQFMGTHDVARITWDLIRRGRQGEIFNVCGKGLVSPREIAAFAGRKIDLSLLPPVAQPRVVEANTEKVEALLPLPETKQSITDFIHTSWQEQAHAQ